MTDSTTNQEYAEQLKRVAADLGVLRAPGKGPRETIAQRRRARGRRIQEPFGIMTVWEVDGVLQVNEGERARLGGMAGRRAARAASLGGRVVQEIPFEHLQRGQISAALEKIDNKLTPFTGLREWKNGVPTPNALPVGKGKILLLIHGTFSNNDTLMQQLRETTQGATFLARATKQPNYDQILSFDHPTLSVSPILNARQLALALGDTRASIDVICHSRGGLVARWWLEVLDRAPASRRRAIFVASPLAGTGLAAPPNLRAALSLLANIGKALGAASSAVPFLAVTTGLFQVFSSVTRLLAKTPVVDAAIAVVPGPSAMSRMANNAEILSLRSQNKKVQENYYAIQSNFEPESVGWKFWKIFRSLGTRTADVAADIIFDGANDLVVDTGSMTDVSASLRLKPNHVHDFGKNSRVHHTSYFAQPESVAFFEEKFRIR